MNIAIDTTPLETGHVKRGVGIYTKNLIDALKRYETVHTYSFFTRGQKVPVQADVVHYPYFDPFFLTLPVIKTKPTVVTVHDLTPLVFPDKFPSGIRGNIKWQVQKLSLRGARRIITDSKNSKKDIARITGFNPKDIDVVYLAPDIKEKKGKTRELPEHFILYVGDVNWNKNVPGLIQAIGHHTLVMVGQAFLNNNLPETQEINTLISSLGLEKQIMRVGFVKDIASLYGQAECLVMPSYYEGFGLPVLEAMASGCPVVAADNSSLSEIAGPAVRVLTTPSSIAQGIETAIKQRQKLVSAGLAWARRFTWKKVARETVNSYEKAFNNHTGL